MTIEEIVKFFEDNKDKEDVKKYLADLKKIEPDKVKELITSQHILEKISEDKEIVKNFLIGEGGKSIRDWAVSNGINTFKEKSLPGLLEDEIKKRFPDETDEQKRNRGLQEKVDAMEKRSLMRDMQEKASNNLFDKIKNDEARGLAKFFASDSEENTLANTNEAAGIIETVVNKLVAERTKTGDNPPGSPPAGNGKLTREQIKNMTPDQLNKAFDEGKLDEVMKGA